MTRSVTIGNLAAWVESPARAVARVLLVHGLGEHSGRYQPMIAHLNGEGVEFVRFDLRGHGRSGGERQWIETFDDYVDDTEHVYRWVEGDLPPLPLFLMGHSLGGAVALAFAANRPHLLRGVILSAPAILPGEGVSPLKAAIGRALSRLMPHLRIPATLDLTALSRDPGVAEDYRRDRLNCLFNSVRQGNVILSALQTLPEMGARVGVPTLIAHGDQDRLIKIGGSRLLFARLASEDKTLKEFPGGFHELHHDTDRQAYFSLLSEWIGKHL